MNDSQDRRRKRKEGPTEKGQWEADNGQRSFFRYGAAEAIERRVQLSGAS